MNLQGIVLIFLLCSIFSRANNVQDSKYLISQRISREKRQLMTQGSLNQLTIPEKLRTCTTPSGGQGFCQDLSDCPDLVLKLSVLRKSVCFKKLFSPGVCCPDRGQLQKLRDEQRKQAEQLAHLQSVQAPVPSLQNHITHQQGQVPLPYYNGAYFQGNPNQQQLSNQPQLFKPQQQLIPATGFHQQLGASNPSVPGISNPQTPQTFPNNLISRDNIIINRNPRNNKYNCGVPVVPQSRVVGGAESAIGAWPWTAAIYLHGLKEREFWCGGSLISEEVVLTAAHCTKDAKEKTFGPDQFTVHLGDYNIHSKDDDKISTPEIYNVRYIIAHPEFRRQGYFNDIALFKLTRPVHFSHYILPVCLPPPALERSAQDALVGQSPTVIGYGATKYDGPQSNILHDVQLPVWKNSDCDKAYFQPISDIFICAGYAEGGRDACQGDSGGPMQLYYGGRWIQVGIVSFGNRCAEPGYPGVYTRITKFLPWIRHNFR